MAVTFHGEKAGDTFTWNCPKCDRQMYGILAEEPVSGWESPRWVLSGSRENPTLTPSLGCRGLQTGECEGHFFLRGGSLVAA